MAGSKEIRAGKAFVEIGAKDQLSATLKKIGRRVEAWGAGLKAMGTVAAASAAAALAPFAVAAKSYMAQGDALDKMSKRTGIAVESLSELAFAADMSGTSIADMEAAVRKMQKTLDDARQGSKAAVDDLRTLRISLSDLEGLSPEQQFKILADRIARIPDATSRAAAAMSVFGKNGTALLPMLERGAGGIEELQAQARALGLTISGEAAGRAAMLDGALKSVALVAKNAAFWIGDALAPALTPLAQSVGMVMVGVRNWIRANPALIRGIMKGIAIVGGLGVGLIALGASMKLFGVTVTMVMPAVLASFTAMKVLFFAMLSPIGLVVAAVAGLASYVLISSGAAGKALRWFGNKWGELAGAVKGAIGDIMQALEDGDIDGASSLAFAAIEVAWRTMLVNLREAWSDFKHYLETDGKIDFAQKVGVDLLIEPVGEFMAGVYDDLKKATGRESVQGFLEDLAADTREGVTGAREFLEEEREELRTAPRKPDPGLEAARAAAKAAEENYEKARQAVELQRRTRDAALMGPPAPGPEVTNKDDALDELELDFSKLLPDMGEIEKKFSSLVTFDVSAAWGFGARGDDGMGRVVKATEVIVKKIDRLIAEVRDSTPVFST